MGVLHIFEHRVLAGIGAAHVVARSVAVTADECAPVSYTHLDVYKRQSLYAMSLLFGLLAMVPAFAVYAAHAGVTATGVVCMALSVVLAPLLPLAVDVYKRQLSTFTRTPYKVFSICR